MNSAEAIVKFLFALLLDALGVICAVTIIGEVVSPIVDIAGYIAFGVSKKRKGSFITFIGELIPFFGAFPFWTAYIIYEIVTEGPFKLAD